MTKLFGTIAIETPSQCVGCIDCNPCGVTIR